MTDAAFSVGVFYVLATFTLLGAAWVAFSTNIVHSAFALFGTLIGVAGLYAYLSADLLTVVQMLVYVGGISILVLFAVMLTSGIAVAESTNPRGRLASAGFASLALLATAVLASGAFPSSVQSPAAPTTEAMGDALLGTYVLPFEVVSMLLLAALIGGVTLAHGWRRS